MWWSERDRATRRAASRGPGSVPRLAVAMLVLAMLSGCGFHFRDATSYPPQMAVMYIDTADRYSPFYQKLVATLRRGGIRLTDDPAQARTTLKILKDDTGRRLLSVTARNVPAEFEVWYEVRFAVDVDGAEAVPAERLYLTRDFAFDETRVLGKEGEEQNIRQAIAADLVGLVSRRLSAVH